MPVVGNCVVTAAGTMLGGRMSNGSLVLDVGTRPLAPNPDLVLGRESTPSTLPLSERGLSQATYTFAGGTAIRSGWLYLHPYNTLASNVVVEGTASVALLEISGRLLGNVDNAGKIRVFGAGVLEGNVRNRGWLYNSGHVLGNVDNDGMFELGEVVSGTFRNNGVLHVSAAVYGNVPRIGMFSQTGDGILAFELAPEGWDGPGRLKVAGEAHLAGILQLSSPTFGWDYSPISTGPHEILHADGGVFGTFDHWTSPGLFIEGALRYGSHDVWFDLTKFAVLAGASSNGLGTALTLASAANLDRALAGSVAFTGQPQAAQHAFHTAAGQLLWMRDAAQATRALNSLSGAIHADALMSTGDKGWVGTALQSRLDRTVLSMTPGLWMHADGNSLVSGVDKWFGPRLVVGIHASHASMSDAATASATDLASGGYLRLFSGDGWYGGLDAGITFRTLSVGRMIDFGDASQWSARSRRSMDATSGSLEAGKRLPLLGGGLTTFVGFGVSRVRAEAATEQGSSGLELQLAEAQLSASRTRAGLRFARDWRWDNAHWLQLDLATGMDNTHWNRHQQAAFIGVPGAWFDLPNTAGRQRWATLGLRGGWGQGWTWTAERNKGRPLGSDQAWRLSLRRRW